MPGTEEPAAHKFAEEHKLVEDTEKKIGRGGTNRKAGKQPGKVDAVEAG